MIIPCCVTTTPQHTHAHTHTGTHTRVCAHTCTRARAHTCRRADAPARSGVGKEVNLFQCRPVGVSGGGEGKHAPGCLRSRTTRVPMPSYDPPRKLPAGEGEAHFKIYKTMCCGPWGRGCVWLCAGKFSEGLCSYLKETGVNKPLFILPSAAHTFYRSGRPLRAFPRWEEGSAAGVSAERGGALSLTASRAPAPPIPRGRKPRNCRPHT